MTGAWLRRMLVFSLIALFIPIVYGLSLDIYSPLSGVSNERRVQFNLTVDSIADQITYIDNSDRNPRENLLCKNCNEYGFSRLRFKSFTDGEHNLTFKSKLGNETIQSDVVILIDSKVPRISKTIPTLNKYANGTFIFYYQENNPKNITLFYGDKQLTRMDCPYNPAVLTQICQFDVDVSEYDGQSIEYWFEVEDIAGNSAQSRKIGVKVDVSSPEITQLNLTIVGKSLHFDIELSEEATLEYYDNLNQKARWMTLCRNCDSYDGRKPYGSDEVDMLVRAVDGAGNLDSKTFRATRLGYGVKIDCNWRPMPDENGCYGVFGWHSSEDTCVLCGMELGLYFNGDKCVTASGCGLYGATLFSSLQECSNVCIDT